MPGSGGDVPQVFKRVMEPPSPQAVDLEAYHKSQEFVGEALQSKGEERLNKLATAIRLLAKAYPEHIGIPRQFIEESYTAHGAFTVEEIDNALNRLVASGRVHPIVYERFVVPYTDEDGEE